MGFMESSATKINLEQLAEYSMREHARETAKKFKTSWVDLGRVLFSIWRDKVYREWGYQKFETYTSKEIGIRKQTAIKLLRSYSFLEREEPMYLKDGVLEEKDVAVVPNYETIDVLRLAKDKKKLDAVDYRSLKDKVFNKGQDAGELRKDLTALIRQREELEPEEAWQKKKETSIKRMVSVLKSLKKDLESSKILTKTVEDDIIKLIDKLEVELT